jgi:Ca2+-binding RTX toxin-like protein
MLVLEPLNTSVIEGEKLGFTLTLQSRDGELMTTTAALAVSFIVSGTDANDDPLILPADRFTAGQDSNGNTWSYNNDGTWTVTATLEAGANSLTVNAEAALSHGTAKVIDTEGLCFTPDAQSMDALAAQDCAIVADGETIAAGTRLEFTIVDAEYAPLATQYGVTLEEAVGKEIVPLTGSEEGGIYYGEEAAHANGQIIIGTDGDNIIHVSQGNDILIGGNSAAGHDIYVWNNENMGHNEQAVDIIKDFNVNKDVLCFEDLLGGDAGGQAALTSMLEAGEWNGTTFNATDASSGTSIQLNLAATQATLQVSYQHGGETYMQNVQLQGIDANQFGTLDQTDVAHMLQEIIKVTM